MIEIGKKAPVFTLKDQHGAAHALRDYAGAPVVLYFYPKDDTSGCTAEACQFRDAAPRFEELDCAVLGVSPDDEASHAKFARKHGLHFTLLSDPGAKVCTKYGVWQEKSMYGRTYMGVVRTTYLIGANGKVAQRWDNVRVPGHVEAVLEAVTALASERSASVGPGHE